MEWEAINNRFLAHFNIKPSLLFLLSVRILFLRQPLMVLHYTSTNSHLDLKAPSSLHEIHTLLSLK